MNYDEKMTIFIKFMFCLLIWTISILSLTFIVFVSRVYASTSVMPEYYKFIGVNKKDESYSELTPVASAYWIDDVSDNGSLLSNRYSGNFESLTYTFYVNRDDLPSVDKKITFNFSFFYLVSSLYASNLNSNYDVSIMFPYAYNSLGFNGECNITSHNGTRINFNCTYSDYVSNMTNSDGMVEVSAYLQYTGAPSTATPTFSYCSYGGCQQVSGFSSVSYDVDYSSLTQGEQKIIDNQNAVRDEIIENQNENQQQTNERLDQIHDDLTSGELDDDTPVDDDKMNDYQDAEDALIDSDSLDLIDGVEISIDLESNKFIWDLVTRILQTHTLVMGLVITMLSLGIVKLILNR